MLFGNRRLSAAEVAAWNAARFIGPVAVFIGQQALGSLLDAWPTSWTSPITSPLTAIFAFGVPLFPGGAYITLTALYNLARAAAARSWPVVKARIVSSKAEKVYGYRTTMYAPVVLASYTVDDRFYEADCIHFGQARFYSEDDALAVAARFPEKAEVDVHYDPDDPETAIVEFEDNVGRRNVWIGVALLLMPFVFAYPIVWFNS